MRAVNSALDWLAASQSAEGTWGKETKIADTSLALLALMAGGNTLGPGTPNRQGLVEGPTKRGPYAEQVQKGIEYLARAACTDRTQWPGYIEADEDHVSRMHGHGFATLALATASGNLGSSRIKAIEARITAGLSPNELPFADRVRWGLERAVRRTERAQDPETGGWYYAPVPESHEGSMTVTQIAALRAAMEAGVSVNGTMMKRAYSYVRDSQNTQNKDLFGGFAYQIDKKDRVSVALTAAALTTFFELGRYGDEPGDRKLIDDGMSYLDRKFRQDFDERSQWYYYRSFYLVQALYLSGDEARQRRYWPVIRDDLLEHQNADGSFKARGVDPERSDEYCTAMGCLILEVPMETLPIFQRR
jgi:hypothetical protein